MKYRTTTAGRSAHVIDPATDLPHCSEREAFRDAEDGMKVCGHCARDAHTPPRVPPRTYATITVRLGFMFDRGEAPDDVDGFVRLAAEGVLDNVPREWFDIDEGDLGYVLQGWRFGRITPYPITAWQHHRDTGEHA